MYATALLTEPLHNSKCMYIYCNSRLPRLDVRGLMASCKAAKLWLDKGQEISGRTTPSDGSVSLQSSKRCSTDSGPGSGTGVWSIPINHICSGERFPSVLMGVCSSYEGKNPDQTSSVEERHNACRRAASHLKDQSVPLLPSYGEHHSRGM